MYKSWSWIINPYLSGLCWVSFCMWKEKVVIFAFYNLQKTVGHGLVLCGMRYYYIIKTRQSTERQKKVIKGKQREQHCKGV